MVTFNGLQVSVERKRQKGVSVTLDKNGLVIVNADEDYTDEVIQNILNNHKRFFNNRIKKQIDRDSVNYPDLNNGGTVYLLGEQYSVVRNPEVKRVHIDLDKLYLPQYFPKYQAETFFGSILHPYVHTLTKLYMEDCWLECSSTGLYSRLTAWGTHFDDDNSIKYNRALVFVPEDCIEYVVVHELCHSIEPNHSKKFWEEVERILPNYKEERQKLRAYDLHRLLQCANLIN